MTFGLRCWWPACRPRPASLPVRVPTVESLLRASFSFTSRLRLAFRYGCRHRLRLAPFIQLDSAHAGHTRVRPGAGRGPEVRPTGKCFIQIGWPEGHWHYIEKRVFRAATANERAWQ